MRDRTTYIKIDRNIRFWGWYKDPNTLVLWLHLLLTANITDHVFMGVEIHRGELATSLKSLAEQTGLSEKCVRTALKHLKDTGEVAVTRHRHFSVISIPRYDYYQDNGQSYGQSSGIDRALTGQQSKNDKEWLKNGGSGAQRRSPAHESVYRMALRLQQEVDEELAAEEAAEAAEDSE